MALIGGVLGLFVLLALMSLIVDLFKKAAGFLIAALLVCGIVVGVWQFAKSAKESIIEDMTESIRIDYEDDEDVSLLTKGKEYIVSIID